MCLSPVHSRTTKNKKVSRTRYYLSQKAIKEGYDKCDIRNINADELEQTIYTLLKNQLPNNINEIDNSSLDITKKQFIYQITHKLKTESLYKIIRTLQPKIIIAKKQINITLLLQNIGKLVDIKINNTTEIHISKKVIFMKHGGKQHILDKSGNPIAYKTSNKNDVLISSLAKAYKWRKQIKQENISQVKLAKKLKLNPERIRHIVRLTELAPDIQTAIVEGTQPPLLSLQEIPTHIPIDWMEQRTLLGFKND